MAALVQHLGTGRRKRSVARVFLRSGKGTITVNGRPFERILHNRNFACGGAAAASDDGDSGQVRRPDSDQWRRIHRSGRRGASRHRPRAGRVQCRASATLKAAGFLTRDPRVHERKKYGQKGARKRFQFSKR